MSKLVEVCKPKIKGKEWYAAASVVFVFLLATFSIYLVIAAAWPWHPIEIYSYEAGPSSICMSDGRDATTIYTSYSADYDVDSYITSVWEDVDTGDTSPGYTGPVVYDSTGGETKYTETRAKRRLPMDVGTYTLKTEVLARGSVMGVPRTERIDFDSGPILTVEDC